MTLQRNPNRPLNFGMQSLLRLAEMRVAKELSNGDGKDITAAVNAYDKLKKQCGYALQMEKGSTMRFGD